MLSNEISSIYASSLVHYFKWYNTLKVRLNGMANFEWFPNISIVFPSESQRKWKGLLNRIFEKIEIEKSMSNNMNLEHQKNEETSSGIGKFSFDKSNLSLMG